MSAGAVVRESLVRSPSGVGAPEIRVRRVRTTDALRASATTWNRLWNASAVTAPFLRAEPIALWCDSFVGPDALDVLWVEADGTPVAGLPLVRQKVKHLVHAGTMPTNPYLAYADLLVDRRLADPRPAIRRLLDEVFADRKAPVWLWLEQVHYDEEPWPAFVSAARDMGLCVSVRHSHDVAHAALADSWDEYRRMQFEGKPWRKLTRRRRLLAEAHGPVSLRQVRPRDDVACDTWVRRVFDVESRGWKHDQGTAVVQHPAVLAYYQRLGRLLAEEDRLVLNFLEVNGRPAAASYGFEGKGTYSEAKLGCDDSFRRFGPGHLLTWLVMERLHARMDIRLVNFFCGVADYLRRWTNATRSAGRVVVAGGGLKERSLFFGYEHVLPKLKRVVLGWRHNP